MKNKTPVKTRRLLTTSVLLALIALASVTLATTAWMTIADRTRVRSMRMEITTGANLRFDLDPHETIEEYGIYINSDMLDAMGITLPDEIAAKAVEASEA